MNPDSAAQKLTPGHLKRDAYWYIRQSTLRQVRENTESTQRQYARWPCLPAISPTLRENRFARPATPEAPPTLFGHRFPPVLRRRAARNVVVHVQADRIRVQDPSYVPDVAGMWVGGNDHRDRVIVRLMSTDAALEGSPRPRIT
jgi:hypothetical protein